MRKNKLILFIFCRYEFFLEDSKISSGDGYFHVVPEWNITGGKKLSLNSLSCITHLAKLLGPLNEWKSRLEVAHKAGYNCIHLTPIQELGISNSRFVAFSIFQIMITVI